MNRHIQDSDRVPFADRPATGMRLLREKFGLEVETIDGAFAYMIGTEDQLVATGLVRPEWFPGKPGNQKVTQRVYFENGQAVLPKGPQNNAGKDKIAIEICKHRVRTYWVWFRRPVETLVDQTRLDFIENEQLVSVSRELTLAAIAKSAARVCVSLKLPPSV